MNKQIIHFSQDPHKPEYYNLIVLATNIGSPEISKEIRDYLLYRDFTIYYFDERQIEAAYKDEHKKAVNKFHELNKTGWKYEGKK